MAICLAGPAGAGKNAVGDFLAKEYGFTLASFAEPLRREVGRITLLEWSTIPDEIQKSPRLDNLKTSLEFAKKRQLDPWAKPTHPVMRHCLQLWGTEYRRHQNPDYWTNQAERGDHVVYTDCRFANEMELGEETWYIHRPEAELKRLRHISESLKPTQCTRVISNDGDLDKLHAAVEAAAAAFFYQRSQKRIAA